MYVALNFSDPDWKNRTVQAMADFAATHRERLDRCARRLEFPRDLYRDMGAQGWVGVLTPRAYGGLGGSVPEYCLIEEEVGRWGLVSPQISIQGQLWLLDWGSEAQKERYLPGMAAGELIFCEAISEPGVGSSLKLMQASAKRVGTSEEAQAGQGCPEGAQAGQGGWVLDGRKTHVNLGAQADLMIVYAMAEEGLTSFLVETAAGRCSPCETEGRETKGLTRRQTNPIGLRLIPTADIELQGVEVSEAALLGAPGEGLKTFLSVFNVSRLGNASELIGFGRRALAEAVTYARQRQVDDEHKVTDFQGIQWTIADAYSKLYAASLARDRAASLAAADEEHALETTLAKKLAIDAAEYAVNESFALIGGYGLYEETPFQQILSDMKVLRVAGGSLEVLRNYIARRVLKSDDFEGLA